MANWSLDIIRQGSWDQWCWLCIIASFVLLSYLLIGQLWKTRRGWVGAGLSLAGIVGTAIVLTSSKLRTPGVGLIWTLVMMGLLASVFYLRLLPVLGPRRMSVLLSLRILTLVLLVPMLFEPVIRYIARPKPEKPLLFLIDTSASMSFPDVQNGPTRLQSVWQALRPSVPKISESFVPRYFSFDTDLREIKDVNMLSTTPAEGKATDIVSAVAKALTQVSRDDAQLVLITDGIDNTSPNVIDSLRASQKPIHTIRVGSEQAQPMAMANISVDSIDAPDDFTVNHESKIKATIRSSALANRVVDVKMSLVDDKGAPTGKLETRKLVLQPLAEGQVVELPFKPTTLGVQRLAVWVDPLAGERSTIDNRQEFQGLCIDPRIKVLYIEGRARPEYQQLSRALSRDQNIELATLLRVQADRFSAGGSLEGEAFKKMPATLEEWKKFDVIILGDLDSSFLPVVQQSMIEQLTSGGAGLLMIGGQNSFGPGGYAGSPIEKSLPVFVGNKDAAQEKTEFVPRLTGEGATHPALEGLSDWFGIEEKAGGKSLPPLRGNVVVSKPKSGATIILQHRGRTGPDGQPQIVLASQMYGKGRSAAFTVDTTYLWYLPMRGMGQDSPYNRLWGQLVRWLAGQDVRNRQRGAGIEALMSKTIYQMGESVHVRALVRDEKGDATRFAQSSLKLFLNDGKSPQVFPLSPVESHTGMYEATIPTPGKGDYRVEIEAQKDGKSIGKQNLKFTVIPPADEMLKLAANPTLLSEIASQTRGFNYELGQLPKLIDDLVRSDPNAGQLRQQNVPLRNVVRASLALTGQMPGWDKKYDLPTQGLLVLVLLTIEWILRRRWQLA